MALFELQLSSEFSRELRLLRAAIVEGAQAARFDARATYALVRVLREIAGNRNASSIEFGPLQVIDKLKE